MSAEDATLSERIARFLARSRDADPHDVARKLMARMDQTERDTALAQCLADRVRIEVTRARMITHSPAPTAGRSKWRTAIRERVCVGGAWLFLDDCGVGELLTLAAEYEVRAEQMQSRATEYRTLAEQVQSAGVATVGELRSRRAAA